MNLERIAVFDTETTGVNLFFDRIVSAYVGVLDVATGDTLTEGAWLIDPHIDIPIEATNVHGITTEHARQTGQDPAVALPTIHETLAGILEQDIPLAIMNAPFDLTLLDVGLRRLGLESDVARFRPIVDPRVIDKQLDRYRKGSRTLGALAETYDIPLPPGEFHGARFDAVLAGRLALRLLPADRDIPMNTVHERQIVWAREQGQGFADYLFSQHRYADADAVRIEWPLVPITDEEIQR